MKLNQVKKGFYKISYLTLNTLHSFINELVI